MFIIKTLFHYSILSLSIIVRFFTNVKKKRVVCNSYGFTRYSCNPKYITEYLLEYSNEFEICWVFKEIAKAKDMPSKCKVIKWRTLKYLYYINTAEFIISNERLGLWNCYWIKRKGQKYIMTWHSSMGLKKIEKDAESKLPKSYIKSAKYDSSMCDLILSGCEFRTKIIENAFWYEGEILRMGTPRNDILFRDNFNIKKLVYNKYGIPLDKKILLYAPTFRKDYSLSHYKLEWKDVINVLKFEEKADYIVMLRLHPVFQSNSEILNKYTSMNIIDVSDYPDIQELLSITDILVTDYSSSIFDFSLLNKPIFIYASDINSFDRGTYLKFKEMPFPIAESNERFLELFKSFTLTDFQAKLEDFNKNVIGSYEKGIACKELHSWMNKNTI